MRRPGYLGDIDKRIPKPRGTAIVESLKAPLKGIVKATQQKGGEKKVIRFSQPDTMPGMSKLEKKNAPKQDRLIAIPEIPASHPLYHDLSLLRKKVIQAQKTKIEKRKEIQQKWKNRPEVLMRWLLEDNRDEKRFSNLMKMWEQSDKQEAKRRKGTLKKLMAKTPRDSINKAVKKQKQDWAEEDARKRALRAADIFQKEVSKIKKYEQHEKEQLKSDKWYNVFRKFYKWPERAKPET